MYLFFAMDPPLWPGDYQFTEMWRKDQKYDYHTFPIFAPSKFYNHFFLFVENEKKVFFQLIQYIILYKFKFGRLVISFPLWIMIDICAICNTLS